MAYDEAVAERVRGALSEQPGLVEKKMFGGLCFMVRGNLCRGIVKDELMVRVGPDQSAKALREPHAREMDFTGRPMKGMVYVGRQGFQSEAALEKWMQYGLRFALSLLPKKK